jgi:hypothetical protein
MRNAASARTLLAALTLAVTISGCTGALPQRYPSRPPAGMTTTQAEQDERACLNAASRATAERAWAYIGCMVSKGHTVGVAFHVRSEPTYMGVTQNRPHEPAAAASELETCRRTAYAAARAGGGSTRDAIVDRMEAAFRTCLTPLGYAVQRDGAPSPGGPGA